MKLEVIAESDAHARWILENHIGVGPDEKRQRCALCEQWWPCDIVGLAALAVRQGMLLTIADGALVHIATRDVFDLGPTSATIAEDALIQMSVVE